MDKVALLDASDRAALFGETGAARGVANTVIEKDFWVCWTLRRLFKMPKKDAPTLIFKGGTSLSKAFGAIRRFSEDIDLSFDRADLGYTSDRDPKQEGISRKQADKLIEDLVGDVAKHIAEKLLPALRAAIAKHLGEPTKGGWSLQIDASDPQTVNFHYPTALSNEAYEGMAYIAPRVKLEFGARGDPWPTEEKTIRPYAADNFPAFFDDPDCTVTVLSARRTFWEKATALHAETHRPKDSPTPQYFSRHYYDVAMLLDTEDGKAAAADFELLEQVAKHKTVFFRSGWAGYDTARPGTLQLMPSEARLSDLRADYRDMAPMMFDDKPLSFDESLARVQKLQDTINASTSASQQPAPLTTPRHATPRAGVGRQRRKIQGAAHGGFAYSIGSHSQIMHRDGDRLLSTMLKQGAPVGRPGVHRPPPGRVRIFTRRRPRFSAGPLRRGCQSRLGRDQMSWRPSWPSTSIRVA